jgi:hypothetical protein
MAQPVRSLSTVELLIYLAVVAYTVFELTRGTYFASREFDPGHRHSGVCLTQASASSEPDSYAYTPKQLMH